MAFRFRKSIKLGPVKFNVTKNGVSSISLGGRGASLNIPVARSGGIRGTVGIPGSGLSMSREFKQAQPVAISQTRETEQSLPWTNSEQIVIDKACDRITAEVTAYENAVAIAQEMDLPVPDFIPSQEFENAKAIVDTATKRLAAFNQIQGMDLPTPAFKWLGQAETKALQLKAAEQAVARSVNFFKGCFTAVAIGIGCLFFASLMKGILPHPSATPEQIYAAEVAADRKAMEENWAKWEKQN
jgi:hypothetical protein